jgi:hypothetical protein
VPIAFDPSGRGDELVPTLHLLWRSPFGTRSRYHAWSVALAWLCSPAPTPWQMPWEPLRDVIHIRVHARRWKLAPNRIALHVPFSLPQGCSRRSLSTHLSSSSSSTGPTSCFPAAASAREQPSLLPSAAQRRARWGCWWPSICLETVPLWLLGG